MKTWLSLLWCLVWPSAFKAHCEQVHADDLWNALGATELALSEASNENAMLREQLRENDALRRVCEQWRDEHHPIAPECTMQSDRVNEACPELAEHVLDVIGYWEGA